MAASRIFGCKALSLAVVVLLAIVLTGCQSKVSESHATAASGTPSPPALDDDKLRAMIDDELNYTFTKRSLNLADHGAWQIMHAVLPFGMHLKVYNGDQPVGALQWVLDGHTMKGWTLQHGTKGLGGGRQGLRSIVEPGKVGQGHPEQWLAIMAATGLPSNTKVVFDGHDYDIRDMVQQALIEMYEGKEASWDLASFVYYLGPDFQWKTPDGQQWNIDRLVSMEARQDLSTSACGGTHRLTGLNKALKAHLKKSSEVTGAWKEAQDKLRDAFDTAHRFQQPDGSLSTSFFSRPGSSPDPVAQMYSTGHTLEFLVMALPDDEYDAPWVKRAVERLCIVFHQMRPVDVECGSLYHATNALLKYRNRKYGPWKFPDDTAAAPPASKPTDSPAAPPRSADKQAGTPSVRQ